MSEEARQGETAPGDDSKGDGFSGGLSSYAIGFALAVLLTVV